MIYLFIIIVFLFSVIIHEVAHGAVANYLGDPTAKNAGRLNLNPIKHLDPIGSIMVPLLLFLSSRLSGGGGVIFGWAKPVPINPYNLRDKKYGSMKVAMAGPLSNLSVALAFGLLLRFFPLLFITTPSMAQMFSYIVFINIQLAVFNLMPIPPLDGSHILFAFLPISERTKIILSNYGFYLLFLAVFFVYPYLLLVINRIFWIFAGFPILNY